MTISADLVGVGAGPGLAEIDARWLMAYAAGVGDTNPLYLDTTREDGIVAHPIFPVCYEWPVAVALRARTVPPEIALRGVHATHDLVIHRLPIPGDRLTTTARIVAVERRKPGAYVLTRFETRDAASRPVTTTEAGTLYLGIAVLGPERRPADPPAAPLLADDGHPCWEEGLPVTRGTAHIYSECARIWNPIHTDRAVAAAAGLPDIILHGTATLALAVSALLAREADGDPTRVRRVRCRFGAMVFMPSTICVKRLDRNAGPDGETVGFQVLTEAGRAAIGEGIIILHP